MDVVTFAISNDHARAQKPDPGYDPLDNAARIDAAGLANGKDCQCRAEPNKTKRAHAGCLAMKIAVKAERDAGKRRSAEPQGNFEGVHSGAI